MKLESQVCSLELAKRLKELGVKQESWHNWKVDKAGKYLTFGLGSGVSDSGEGEVYSAFTVAELGEMLPKRIKGKPLSMGFDETIWWVQYSCAPLLNFESMREVDARVKMLIYLIEQGLIKP